MLVVVPAWNEQASVGAVVRELLALGSPPDVLVVDDGSGDRTSRAAAEAGAAVCRLPFNLGVGGAMRTGYRYAVREGYDVVVQVDADGQHDPKYIPRLIEGLEDADVVVGARFAGEGEYAVRGPRRWAMRLLARVLSRLAHQPLSDVTSGFRAVNRRGIRVFAVHYPSEYLGDTVESLVIAVRTGCRVRPGPSRDADAHRRQGEPEHAPFGALPRTGGHRALPGTGPALAGEPRDGPPGTDMSTPLDRSVRSLRSGPRGDLG